MKNTEIWRNPAPKLWTLFQSPYWLYGLKIIKTVICTYKYFRNSRKLSSFTNTTYYWLTTFLLQESQFAVQTLYYCFENMGRFVILKKKVQNMGCKKQDAKKQGHCYSKREEAAWPLFWFFCGFYEDFSIQRCMRQEGCFYGTKIS